MLPVMHLPFVRPSRPREVFVVLLLVAGLTGCQESPPTTEEPPAASVAAAAETGPICGEHGVPEAACTICHPELIPKFQAANDWCAEHGLPESVCPICRGTAPAGESAAAESDQAATRDDDTPADGTKVRLASEQTAEMAGIRVATVIAAPSRDFIAATGRLVYDARRRAELNPRVPGVIREIRVEVGAKVRAGEALAVLESAGVGDDRSRLDAARSHLRVAEHENTRMEALAKEGLAPARERDAARHELEAAQAELRAAEAAVELTGTGSASGGRYELSSPIAGVVTARHAAVGQFVDLETTLFEIADTGTLWAELDLPERDLRQVRVGQRVELDIDGRSAQGRLAVLAPAIDPETRTAKGRVVVSNRDGSLRAEQFVRAQLAVGAPRPALLVPAAAVQRVRQSHLVFVRIDPVLFEVRRVDVLRRADGLVEVGGRLAAGDEVATDGSFLLKTETLRSSIGSGCCEVGERGE